MQKLKERWGITSNWQIAMILVVFSVTGSTAAYIGKPILQFFSINQETLNPFIYWTLRIVLLFIVYQFLLVIFGWIFGQFQFFWNFEKKMLRRIGFKRFLSE